MKRERLGIFSYTNSYMQAPFSYYSNETGIPPSHVPARLPHYPLPRYI